MGAINGILMGVYAVVFDGISSGSFLFAVVPVYLFPLNNG